MPRTKTDEILHRLERIEKKIDTSINMWVMAIGISFVLYAITLFKQNPMLSLLVMFIGALLGIIPLYVVVFLIPRKKV